MDLHEEDANISAFRRGNKIVAVGFTLLIISLTLFILVLAAVLLLPTLTATLTATLSYISPNEISVEKFCSYSQTPMCITGLNSIVADRFATDPQQLVAHCIEAAAADLQDLIAAASSNKSASETCSRSLWRAAELVGLSLEERVRAKRPLLGWLIKERDGVVLWWLMDAHVDVDSCLRESGEEPAEEVAEKLDYVRGYLYGAHGYLGRTDDGTEQNEALYMEANFGHLFTVFLCGVQTMQLFLLGFICFSLRNRSGKVSVKQFCSSFPNTIV